MTTTVHAARNSVDPAGPTPPPLRPGDRRRGVLVALGVCVIVAVLATVPLINNRIFYYWDDSAAQFLPTWFHLGQQVLAGNVPPMLDLQSWMGGDIAAEALFGIYNPLNVANFVLVASLPDLAVAALLVKVEFVMLLALGAYLVAREYRAARWAAAAVAIALPFGGFTLYFDTSVWAAGLISFAWVPHVWWSARRAAQGRLNPIWAFLIGALAITSGNPYGVLGTAIVLLGLLIEFGWRREWPVFRRALALGCCIGAVVPLVFLPLLGTASVSWRAAQGIYNDNMLVPGIGDLLNSSMPSYLPQISSFGGRGLPVPATYFAWFVIPLLPWLDWRGLRRRKLPLAALVVGLLFTLLALGPSQLWMFRWPVRLTEYAYLGIGVVFAVLLTNGLRGDNWRRRAVITAITLVATTYFAVTAWPQGVLWHLGTLLLMAALTAAAVYLSRRGGRWLATVMAVGTGIILLVQTTMFPGNFAVQPYHYPHSVQALRNTFANRYQGTTMQFAQLPVAANTLGLYPTGAWQHFLFGNAYRPAGVEAVNAYTGLGFAEFSDTFCMSYIGESCPAGYQNLWKPTNEGGLPLADLMRVDTVVVQHAMIPDVPREKGWQVTEQDSAATVMHRQVPMPYPDGRVSYAGRGLLVTSDTDTGTRLETVDVSRRVPDDGPDDIVFARLNWPGYSAEVNGTKVPVVTGPAGLVVVRVPAGVSGVLTLSWTPPGLTAGIGLAGIGLLGGLILCALHVVRRRRSRPTDVLTPDSSEQIDTEPVGTRVS